jgi:Leucine-rich repeat (LRR) protein
MLWQLTQLQSLAVGGVALQTLPESLGQLAQLESLNINGCLRLATLLENLGRLTKL